VRKTRLSSEIRQNSKLIKGKLKEIIMAGETTVAKLNGLFKYVFGEGPINLIPQNTKLLRAIPLQKSKPLGRSYIFPVIVADEQGSTFNTDGSAFALNDAVSMQTEEASVQGVEIVYRGSISYKAVSAAINDSQAFANALALKVERLSESHARAAEFQLLYGGSGLGDVSSLTGTTGGTATVTVTDATWGDGIWTGSNGMKLDFYRADDSTKINSGALSVTSVDYDNKRVAVSGAQSDINLLTGATAYLNYKIYKYGAKSNEMVGINKILTTTTGTLFGINVGSYDLFKPSSYSTSGTLDFAKIQLAVVQAVGRGLMEDVVCYVSPKQWSNLTADQASLRMYDQSYNPNKLEQGFSPNNVTFYAANGKITIEPHPMVKNGDAFILPINRFKRVGSTDITFQRPGRKDDFFRDLESSAGYELRTYSDFAIVCEAPSRCVKITGFTA
jgi:hypothetical protein